MKRHINKNIFKIIFSIFIVLFIFRYNTSVFATDEELTQINNSRTQLEKINQQKKAVQNKIKDLNKLKNDTQNYIKELDKALEELINQLNITLENIDLKQAEIDETNVNLNITKENERIQYANMKKRIVFFYERDNASIIEEILSGDNLVDMLTRGEYIKSITDYDRQKLDELKKIENEIIELEKKLSEEKEELVLLRQEETANKENIENLIFEKQKELEDTKSRINTSSAELKKLEKDQQAQEERIIQIERAIEEREKAKSGGKRTLNGGLMWPCPSSNRITSYFGKRSKPTKGASTDHKGIDIGASTGDKVIAAASGEVVASTYSYSAGNYIMISHGSGVYTIYMHLSKKSVAEGEEVVKGQKIGEVGSTGYATGPHLHFGVRKNGNYVNPLTYVG